MNQNLQRFAVFDCSRMAVLDCLGGGVHCTRRPDVLRIPPSRRSRGGMCEYQTKESYLGAKGQWHQCPAIARWIRSRKNTPLMSVKIQFACRR